MKIPWSVDDFSYGIAKNHPSMSEAEWQTHCDQVNRERERERQARMTPAQRRMSDSIRRRFPNLEALTAFLDEVESASPGSTTYPTFEEFELARALERQSARKSILDTTSTSAVALTLDSSGVTKLEVPKASE